MVEMRPQPARVRTLSNVPLLDWGAFGRPLAGERESGDSYVIQPFRGGCLAGAVDGSGHGSEAAAAARIAVSILRAHAAEGVIPLFRRCHEALRGSRGVVMSLASFDGIENTMTWLGVGNIEGLVVRGKSSAHSGSEALLMRAGMLGYRLPPLQAPVLSVGAGDMLILTTDGIRCDFAGALPADARAERIAEQIATQHCKGHDDGLALVVRYLGWSG